MFNLRMLGGISLTDDAGVEVDALLRQSKHIALLAYLASPRPGTWHKRDSILGTFWAEHDQARSRSALRSALYTVRRHLPDDAIRARGDNDLSVDPDVVATDTALMAGLYDKGEYEKALAYYTGEFLPGIYVADAELFEQWLESERRRTRAIASNSARRLSEKLQSENDLAGAIRAARRNHELDPDDEGTARRLISLLDLVGDRAQAFAVYEQFRNHLSEAFGVRPSAETVALLDAVRTRHELGNVRPAASPSRAMQTVELDPPASLQPQHGLKKKNRSPLLLLIPFAIAAIAWIAWPGEKAAPRATAKTLVVLPVANETGDADIDYLATGIADDLTRRLNDLGGLRIRSAAFADWPANLRSDLRRIAQAYNADLLLRTSLRSTGDSLQLKTSVIDVRTLAETPVRERTFSRNSVTEAESRVIGDIAASVFHRREPPAQPNRIDPVSDDLTKRGYYFLLFRTLATKNEADSARDAFLNAIRIDRTNARAWTGLSSILASETVTDKVDFDEGYERTAAAVEQALAYDSLQGAALANLGGLLALKERRVSKGLPLIRKAEAAEPSNPEVYFIKSMIFRNAHLWDEARDAIRVARSLEPLNSLYIDRETIIDFCEGRPDRALALYEKETPLNPADGLIQNGTTRALAMLGRYEEALDSWRETARQQGDTALARQLASAHGKEGYWGVRHAIGRKRLEALQKRTGRVPVLTWMQSYFAAGDSARGFEAMDQIVRSGTRVAYRFTCMPDVDEFRNTPRFKATVAKAGGLPR